MIIECQAEKSHWSEKINTSRPYSEPEHVSAYVIVSSDRYSAPAEFLCTLRCFWIFVDELDKFEDKPSEAGSSLTQCLNNASAEVPWAIKQYTPVYLGATAGMRILRLVTQVSSTIVLKRL